MKWDNYCLMVRDTSEGATMSARKGLRTVLIGLAMWAALAGGVAHAAVIVVPNTLETTEGNTFNAFPFSLSGVFPPRYQQVFDASEFTSLSGPEFITQIAFRPDGNDRFGSAFTATIPNIQINLSTTSKAPDGLDTLFDNNVGSDDTVVFNGSLPLSSSYTGPLGGPKDFDIVIPLTTPFLYDRSAGNLLLDVRNSSEEMPTTTFFDAQFSTTDSISRVLALGPSVIPDTNGLVAQFTTSPVTTSPEDMEVPFANFTITKAEIEFKTIYTINDKFKVKGKFKLGADSDGFDLYVDEVVVTAGTAIVTIPAGSFTEEDYGKFRFKGTIDGAHVKMEIKEVYGETFRFKIKAKGVDLTGTPNPLGIGLAIGNDSGTDTIRLKGKLKFKAHRDLKRKSKFKAHRDDEDDDDDKENDDDNDKHRDNDKDDDDD